MPERKTLNEDLFSRGSSANLPRLHTCENKTPFWDKSKPFASHNQPTIRIYSKQHVAFLCSFHLAFSQCILFEFKWCTHTIVFTQPQLGKKSCFILSVRSDFHMINNLSIAAMLSLCICSHCFDEILLPKYVNWSTNFWGLLLSVEMAPSCLKHMNSVLKIQINEPCLLWNPLQTKKWIFFWNVYLSNAENKHLVKKNSFRNNYYGVSFFLFLI